MSIGEVLSAMTYKKSAGSKGVTREWFIAAAVDRSV
jgi:hypothetical protein